MAVLAQANLAKIGDTYGSATAGAAVGYAAADVAGDFVPLVGSYVIVTWKTTGTLTNITLDSVAPSNQGSDEDIVIALSATDEREIVIDLTAGGNRFKQTSGNIGYAKFTYSSVTGVSIRARSIA